MNYEKALKAALVHEGGKVHLKADPGGRTNQGVIQRVYDGYRRNKGVSPRDVYLMDDRERDEIYQRQYWNAVLGDRLPPGVAYVVFDGAVNSGPTQSIKWLQRALGVRVDGAIGEATVNAACQSPNHDALVDAICNQRLRFLKALKTWKTFGKGWTRRVEGVRSLGKAWASGADAPMPVFFAGIGMEAKAPIEDAKGRPSRAAADAATGGGIASGGAAGMLQQAQESLEPYAYVSEWVQRIVVLLVIVGIVATAGGFVYTRWAKRRQQERADALDLPVTP